MYRYIALFVVFCALSQGGSARIRNCDSLHTLNATVTVSNCTPKSAQCNLKKGTEAQINLGFTPNADINQLYANVYGILGGVAIPFKLPNSNACINSGLDCPLQAGKLQNYSMKLPISASYPQTGLDVLWTLGMSENRSNEIHDSNDKVCVLIPVKIIK